MLPRYCITVASGAVAAIAIVLSALLGAGVTRATIGAAPVSSDPYTNTTSQHQTEVEPDTFAFGSTVVSAFQVGRFFDGGASNIGWATSIDGGVTWTNGFLPSLTVFSTPSGTAGRVSDPAVAYDATHGVWLITSLSLTSAGVVNGIVVSRSSDGTHWGAPVNVAPGSGYDKEWIVCDNGAGSPFKGRCYTSWDNFGANNTLLTSTSLDGGLTWGAPIAAVDGATGLGTQPLVQPNGTLIIPSLGVGAFGGSIISIRSTNGGASFSAAVVISSISVHPTVAMRAGALPSAEIDAGGKIYVAWHDCRFRAGCAANDIVYSASADGIAWSAVSRVPIDPLTSGVDHFIPGLAVDTTTSGAAGRIGLVYYYFSSAACTTSTCQLNAGFVASSDGGATWTPPKRLNANAMSVSWLPDTNQGRMVGDYIAAVFTPGAVASVIPIASAPSGAAFNLAMYSDRELWDSDGDWCPDVREAGPDHRTGGQRSANNPYDFFDVPAPVLLPGSVSGTPDRVISIRDVIAILAYVGTSAQHPTTPNGAGATYGSDLNNNGLQDGREYDRSSGAAPWAPGPPDGAVSIGDAIIALNSVGDNCN